MKIGILNSGGDCPGLNAVIHGVVGAADRLGWGVVGFRDGFEGLLSPDMHFELTRYNTNGIVKLGGTILGTTNKGHFAAKVGAGDVMAVPAEIVSKAKKTFTDLGLGGLIVVGGDGSLTTAMQLVREGWPVVGVPKTIDNDLQATATTFGFHSAVASVVGALDNLHTTGTSHKRVMVLEVMGRQAGWIALHGGLGGDADVILLPEIPYSIEKVAARVKERMDDGQPGMLVVVAEGAKPAGGGQVKKAQAGAEDRLGGIGQQVAEQIEKITGRECRTCVLGHLQRGGSPTALDRILGTRFGVMAVQLIRDRQFGRMVSYQSYQVGSVPIEHAVHRLHLVDPQSEIVHAARAVGICFGD